MRLRFGFVTCVRLGLSCMEEIYGAGGELAMAMTLRDDLAPAKSGRIYLDPFCQAHAIPLHKVRSVNDPEAVQALRQAGLDWVFIIGWSQIAGAEVLAAPARGVLGMHPSLLPEGRGRAAIPWAILKGLAETGVTLFQLDLGVDTGPILAQERLPVGPDESATSLYARVEEAHRRLLRRIWPDLVADRVRPVPQDPGAGSVWPGRKPEDGRILPHMTVAEVERLVRAVSRPYPGAFLERDAIRMRIWAGRAGEVPGAPVIPCADGSYTVTDFELE